MPKVFIFAIKKKWCGQGLIWYRQGLKQWGHGSVFAAAKKTFLCLTLEAAENGKPGLTVLKPHESKPLN